MIIHNRRWLLTMWPDRCGLDKVLSGRQPGPTVSLHRKLAISQLGSQPAIMKFAELQDVKTASFLERLLVRSGAELDSDIKRQVMGHTSLLGSWPTHAGMQTDAANSMIGSMLLKIIYGYRVETARPDPLVEINDRMVEIFASVTLPGAWLVDIVPWLKYLPDWMPGTGFKSVARRARQVITTSAEVPFQFAKQRASETEHGTTRSEPSLVGELVRTGQQDKSISDEDIQWTAASLYGAGIDTTGSTLRAFFLAMSVFPDVQRRAQKEIDEVVGRSRLPQNEDRVNLPYVNAVVKESLRWLPSVPLGVPHTAQSDDELHGFRIPRGAILMPSTWWFTRDPAVYHEPERFMPERYLVPLEEPDPAGFVFGFGRRICAGRRLAESTLFLAMAKVLAAFDIGKGRDAQGREIQPEIGIDPGAVAGPLPFSVTVKPRDEKAVQLVRLVQTEDDVGEGDAKYLDQGIMQFIN